MLTYPVSSTQLWDELAFTLEHLGECGIPECNVLFGYAWGNEYYADDQWVAEPMALSDVIAKVTEVEGRGIGRLGSDDLYLEFPTFSFLFCNDSDVHLRFCEDAPLVEFFFSRWERLGYKPAEWRLSEGGRKVKERGDDTNA